MKKLIVTGFILAISGCGGGGSPSDPVSTIATTTTSTVLAAPVVERQYFLEKSELLPDLRPYFDQLCGNDTQVGDFLVVDLEGNGKNDFVISLWCGLNQSLYGTAYNGPVKNTLIIVKQKNDGTFYVANQEYFGKDIVPMSGAGGTGAIAYGDFNNDGKVDVAFARHKEDGRSLVIYQDGTTNFSAYPQVLMSTKTGYELQTIPYYLVNNTVQVFKNYNNIDEIVVGGNNFAYVNNTWIRKGDFTYFDNSSTTFNKNGSNYLLSQIGDNENFGVMLSKQTSTGFKSISKFSLGAIGYANFYDPNFGNSGPIKQTLVNIKGEYWFWTAITNSCYAGSKGDTSTFFVIIEGVRLKNYIEGKTYVYGVDIINHDYVGRVMKVVTQGDSIVSMDWDSEVITYNKNIECVNVNMDNNIDYVVNRWLDNTNNPLNVTTNPYVYLNNGLQNVKVSDSKFPTASGLYKGQTSYLIDINNDGKPDLVYLPGEFKDKNYSGPVRIQIFVADKLLD